MNDSLHPTHDSAIGLVGLLAQKEIQEKIPKTIAELRKVVIENINRGAVIVAVSTHLNNIYELPAEVAYALASKGFAEKTTEFVHHFINIFFINSFCFVEVFTFFAIPNDIENFYKM